MRSAVKVRWGRFLRGFYEAGWGIPLGLVLVVALVCINSLPGTFILDDLIVVKNNMLVSNPDLVTIFRSDYWHGTENSGLYRPLTILSLALNRMLLGPNPLGFHLVNVLLHAGVAVLLWRTLLAWGLPVIAAGVGALIFAVHPIHTEVVDIVVGRSELMVALFLLCGFIVARRRGAGAGLLVCLCYLLALLSKEHAITFLVLLPLWDAFAAGSPRVWKERWPLYAGLFVVAVGWLFWRKFGVIMLNSLPSPNLAEAVSPLAYVDGTTRVLTALLLQGVYLGKLLLPVGLQAVYSVTDLPAFPRSVFSPLGMLVVMGTLGALLLLAWGWRQRSPLALFGTLYVVACLPTANIAFPIGVSMAERLIYFPSVWFCAGLGVFSGSLLARSRLRRWCWAALVCYALWLGGMTFWRNFDFTSEVRLWRAEVINNPTDFLGWESLAQSLQAAGRVDEADMAFHRMLEIAPDYPGGLRSATVFFLQQNLYEQALQPATRVFMLSQAQADPLATAFDGLQLAEVHLYRGACEKALDCLEGPALPFSEQLRFVAVHSGALACLGRNSEAATELARVDPNQLTPKLHYQYGVSLLRLGQVTEARMQLEAAVKSWDDAEAWNLLGVVCAQQADLPAALSAFSRAVDLRPESVDYRENLLRAQRDAGEKGDGGA